jgi:hypothetical protein
MTAPRIEDVIEPVRDLGVAALLELLASTLDKGGEVEAEPIARDRDGHMLRFGALSLPSRHDVVSAKLGALVQPDGPLLPFRTLSTPLGGRRMARIAPFRWSAAPMRLRRGSTTPDWIHARRWFLEWFQPRFGEESPDLSCVTHKLDGPQTDGDGFRFTVDLGSAPVSGFLAMIEAFGRCGCADLAIGEAAIAL